jgi:hypothetical protein
VAVDDTGRKVSDPAPTEDGWLATCLSNRAESPTAEGAIRQAIGAPLDGRIEALEAWIADHVAELDAAGES